MLNSYETAMRAGHYAHRELAPIREPYEVCIDELLGPEAKRRGMRCGCGKCNPPRPDYKRRAAGDAND